jgi:hypothetical protein
VPIVFVIVPDPVGAGFVDSLARPGGNATGFMSFEYSISGKWLELLKQMAPNVHLAEDRRRLFHPCFATRLGGVSGGKESQGWRDSSHTAMVGAGKFGSAKLPMATATYPGKPSPSQ